MASRTPDAPRRRRARRGRRAPTLRPGVPAAAHLTAPHGALHRRRPSGVAPRSGQEEARQMSCGRWAEGGRSGCTPERRGSLAGDDAVDEACRPRDGKKGLQGGEEDAARVGPTTGRCSRRRPTARWRGTGPMRNPLDPVRSKMNWIGESTTAASARSVTRRSRTRCTLTIGDWPEAILGGEHAVGDAVVAPPRAALRPRRRQRPGSDRRSPRRTPASLRAEMRLHPRAEHRSPRRPCPGRAQAWSPCSSESGTVDQPTSPASA